MTCRFCIAHMKLLLLIFKYNTAVITFDQPLWYKAMEITNAKSLDVVLVLHSFHLMMSFLGSVGMVMDGSGITDALKTIYRSNTVQHMMPGKAIS